MNKIVGNPNLKTFHLFVKKPTDKDWFQRMRSPAYGEIDDQEMKFKSKGFQTKIITSDSYRVAKKQLKGVK
tara:strand:+ start:763 stop:975 length:213 start_codon:yes stop_codon:yes gene_type:complete